MIKRNCPRLLLLLTAACLAAGPLLAQYDQVQDDGTNLTKRDTINFEGDYVRCEDDSSASKTTCKIGPDGGGHILYVEDFITSGTDAGDWIEDCVDQVLTNTSDGGGICDARGLVGTQTISGMTLDGANHVTILFGNTRFDVTDTILIKETSNLSWIGTNSPLSNSATGGTLFLWRGSAANEVFELANVARSVFENFTVQVKQVESTDYTVDYGFRLYNTSTAPAASSRIFRNIRVTSNDGLDATQINKHAFFWDDSCTGCLDEKNDIDVFYNVAVSGYREAGFRITGGQSKTHTFYSCRTWGDYDGTNASESGKYGVFSTKGTFRWYSGWGGRHNEADFRIENPFDAIVISGCNHEDSNRLLEVGYSTSIVPVTMEGCRWGSKRLASTGQHADRAIVYEGAGNLNLIGNSINTDTVTDMEIYFKGNVDGTERVTATAIGNAISSTLSNPFTTFNQGRWVLQSNQRDTGGTPSRVHIPDQALEVGLVGDDFTRSCSSGDYRLWADSGSGELQKCEDGEISDLSTEVCGTASVDAGVISGLSASEVAATATDVLAGDTCSCSPESHSNWGTGVIYQYCRASAADEVTVRLFNASASATADLAAVDVRFCCSR